MSRRLRVRDVSDSVSWISAVLGGSEPLFVPLWICWTELGRVAAVPVFL